MASMSSAFGPKLRSRKHGAAIPLDERDKRLLNLMQGSFPIAPRPYQHVAAQAEMTEEQAIARVQELIDHRIIRQVTPIFDTRALGYSSMLVAAKVDPENPWRAATVINEHPGVSHNYLRNHEFNIWFTIATEPDSPLGLDRTLEVLGEIAGAESIRQLPTLKLFKIRMDLEMEGGTDALAKAVEVGPAGRDRAPALRRARHRGDPRAAGRHADRRRALRAGRRAARDGAGRAARTISRACRSAGCCGASRRSCSTAAPASAPTAWASGRFPTSGSWSSGPQMAAFRGISHCYQRPDLQGLAVLDLHDGARTLQGRMRRDPRLDRRLRPGSTSARRCTPRPSSRRSGCCTSPRTTGTGNASTPACEPLRRPLSRAPCRCCPGGVNSPVRAMRSIGRDPIFIASGSGATDPRRRRQRVRRLGLLVGSADPGPRESGRGRRRRARRPRAVPASARRPRPRSSSPTRSRDGFRRSRCCG